MSEIKFGTDGWRAIIDEDFNNQNVKRVSIAIAKYIFDEFGYDKKILIGYDPRKKADYFADLSANVFKNCGFKVLLTSKVVPTPVLAYGAKIHNACAIMFTASHNPPEYLGIKFIPDYAGPATDEITSKILKNIDKQINFKDNGEITLFDFSKDYINYIETVINFKKIIYNYLQIL